MLGGCGKEEGGRTEIRLWAMGAEGEHVRSFIPEFERRHPGITVNAQIVPWTAAHEKLLTAYAGGSMPDVFQLGNTWIPEFSALSALEDLGPFVRRSSVVNDTSYFPGIWQTNLMDSVLYGVPWYVDTRVMFYRTDILARAGYPRGPRTWEQLLDASRKIVGKPDGKHYALLLPSNEWAAPVLFGMQEHSALLRDNNTYGNFEGPEFSRAFHFLNTFYHEQLSPLGISQVVNVYQGFAEGFFALYITGPWNIGEFLRRIPPAQQDAWMTSPLPAPDSASWPGVSLAGGSSLVIFSGSRHKEAAWQLIEYMSEPERQVAFYKVTGDLPARLESWNDSTLATNAYVKAFYTQLNHVMPAPKIPEWEQITVKIQDYSELASRNPGTIDETLRMLDRDVNQILEKRRWIMARKGDGQ